LLINIGIFISSMALTMLLGFQSKNVNQSKIVAAIFTSIGISICNLIFVKVALNQDLLQVLLLICGSAIGIALSIIIHDKYFKKKP
jgi:uncharacterized membrane protein YfcA